VFDTTGGPYPTELTPEGFRSYHNGVPHGTKLSDAVRVEPTRDEIGPPRTASGPPAPDSGSTGGSRAESWQEKGVIVSTDWPTPMGAERQQEPLLNGRGEMNLPAIAIAAAGKTGGKLNPSWVETLMAFPIGWSQLPTKFVKPKGAK
jgi:hypothetical protein